MAFSISFIIVKGNAKRRKEGPNASVNADAKLAQCNKKVYVVRRALGHNIEQEHNDIEI